MKIQHKVGQIRNLFRKLPERGQSLDWVFIHGLPRSGTSYVLNQYLKVAKCGIGDWELDEFFRFIRNTRERDYVTLDTERAMAEMRDNILDNAHVGGGQKLDIVVKQIDCTQEAFEMLKELFGGEPKERRFLFREPSGWMASAQEKFGLDEEAAEQLYLRVAERAQDMTGEGELIEYGPGMEEALKKSPFLVNKELDPFEPSRKDGGKVEALWEAYEGLRDIASSET